MATPEQPQTIHLQGVGRVPATPATSLKAGDQLIYNYGGVYQITKITDATPKYFDVTEVSSETGQENTHRVKKDRLVAYVPQEHHRPIGYQDAPATSYRAQVRAPEFGQWVTVGYGATVEEAIGGLTPSGQAPHYFGTVMLDNHGLGYTKETPDGRADSVKAMTEGETLTAADGHSFRILPPEQGAPSGGWTDADAYHLDILDTDGTVYAHKDVDRQEAERLAAHESRAGTTRDDETGVITVHGLSTNLGPRTHVLTPQRPGAEWPCMVTEQAPARQAVEGVVLPAGHTLGIPAEHADNGNARDAYGALVAAGHTPAELSNRSDDGVDDTAHGTGFVIYARESAVLVGHLVDGVDMWNALPDDERRKILRAYRDTMRAAGWETDGRVIGKRLHAWRTSPLPEGVTAAQTRGEAPQELPEGPVKVRFGLSDDTRAKLRESGQRAREEFRAEFDERKRREAARNAPLAIGTRVRHASQEWATSTLVPEGTAMVAGVGRTHGDGSVDYKVIAGRDLSRRIDPRDNPMDKPEVWNSLRVRKVAPPYFEMPKAPEGCRFEIDREHGRTIIRMYNSVTAAPEFESWTYHDPDGDVVPSFAREMARVHNNAVAETRALLALDDAVMYQVATSAGDVETMDGRAARARLQSYREQAGPEKLNSRNTPGVTLAHSGAHWLLTVHAYKNGHRDLRNTLRVSVEPLVTAKASHALRVATGGGTYVPMEKLSVEAFGPWVRPVLGFPEHVVVHWVACGTPVQPEAERYAEHMETYRAALEGAGWRFLTTTGDGGMVFQDPATLA